MTTAELQKLALSQIVYDDLPVGKHPTTDEPWTIDQLIRGGFITGASYSNGAYAFSSQLTALSGMLDWTLANFQSNTSSGFAGAAFKNTANELVFSFRGTEPHLFTNPVVALQDFAQDLEIAMDTNLPGPSQFNDAYEFWANTLQQVGAGNYSGYSFTGHSLGGGIAQYMTYATNEAGHATTFNAVGIGQVLDGVDPADYNDSIKDYVNQNDIIGQYGVQLGTTIYVTDMGNYNYNSITDNIQVALQIAVLQSLQRGEITQAQAMAALNGLLEVNQTVHNAGSDLFFGAHGLDTLITPTGELSQEVAGPNEAISALTKVVNGNFTVTGWAVDGVNYVAIEVVPAIGEATAKVIVAKINGAIQAVTVIGETTWSWVNFIGDTVADIIYNTAMVIGGVTGTIAEVASALYQSLFGDHVVITGTGNDDALAAPSDYMSTLIYGFTGNDSLHGSWVTDSIDGGSGDDELYGYGGNDYLYGKSGNDIIKGGNGDDALFGGTGDDELYGDNFNPSSYFSRSGNGNDVLDGGAGNDYLDGGDGDDTYIFGLGYGQDTIYDVSGSGSLDILCFKAGIRPNDIYLHRRDDDLYLQVSNTTDSITIKSFFYTGNGVVGAGVIEQIRFADGTIWDEALIREKARHLTESYDNGDGTTVIYGYDNQNDIIHGDVFDNKIYAQAGNDLMYGNDGNDYIQGGAGDDVLVGGSGNDTLYGDNFNPSSYFSRSGNGNDVLDGGAGNDYLDGGNGDDVYIFGIGYGQDIVYDSSEAGSLDIISFKAGITPSDIYLHRRSDDLYLGVDGTTDGVTIQNFFRAGSDGIIEQVKFADDTVWDESLLREKARTLTESIDTGNGTSWMDGYSDQADIAHGDAYDSTIYTYGGNDVIYGNDGSDYIQGGNDDDVLFGGEGNDKLYGDNYNYSINWGGQFTGAGNDILDGGTGDDELYGGAGNDTYVFAANYGQDSIYDVGGDDKVLLGHDKSTVVFERVNDNLRMVMAGSLETLTVNAWYSGQNYQIEEVEAPDGSIISNAQIEQLIQAMASWSTNNGGMSWSQALSSNSQDVQNIVAQYWTAPTV